MVTQSVKQTFRTDVDHESRRGRSAPTETRRVASLLPFMTDIVQELKLSHLLVAVSHDCQSACDLPTITSAKVVVDEAQTEEVSAAWNQVTAMSQDSTLASSICSYYNVDVTTLASVRPTHILTHVAAPRTFMQPDYAQVEQAVHAHIPGVKHLVSRSATTLRDIYILHHDIAAMLGTPAAAVAPVALARARLANVTKMVCQAQGARRMQTPSVAVVQWTQPIYLAGGWIPDVISIGGGRANNPMPLAGQSSQVASVKALSHFDYVLFVHCAMSIARGRQVVDRFWIDHAQQELAGSSRTAFAVVDGTRLFSWLGVSNVVSSAEVVAEVITGSSLFGHKGLLWQSWTPPV